ncbi:MAG: hypothetical protein RIR01_2416 [Bacteroidota bacterium]|jgi:hypothetical protein
MENSFKLPLKERRKTYKGQEYISYVGSFEHKGETIIISVSRGDSGFVYSVGDTGKNVIYSRVSRMTKGGDFAKSKGYNNQRGF